MKSGIDAQLAAYEQVLPNLRKHNPDYPDSSKLAKCHAIVNETERTFDFPTRNADKETQQEPN